MSEIVWFNTGVLPGWGVPPTHPYGCQVVRGGTIQIPVVVDDIPESGIFEHAKDVVTEHDRLPFVAWREIRNAGQPGALVSKLAFFRIPMEIPKP